MKIVVDRFVQYPNRFQLTNTATGEVLGVFDFEPITGTVQQVGTEINAELFQSIQDDLTKLAQDIVAERNARGVDVRALQDSIAARITANGGELGNAVVTFREVSNATNIASGEKASTLFGKIKNWIGRLKTLAFKDTIADVDVASNANISQSKVSGLTAIQNKLNGIAEGANKYSLPAATTSGLGGVKVGSGLSVSSDGTLSANSQTENSYTTTEKNKLAGIESGAQKNAVTSVAGKTGAVSLAKGDVGLGNVDNVKQYSANNPPPYPVTSVNGKTGNVVVSVPTKTSELVNDSNYIVGDSSGNVPTSKLFKDVASIEEGLTTAPTVPAAGISSNGIYYNTDTSYLDGDDGVLAQIPTYRTLPIVAGDGISITKNDSGKAEISSTGGNIITHSGVLTDYGNSATMYYKTPYTAFSKQPAVGDKFSTIVDLYGRWIPVRAKVDSLEGATQSAVCSIISPPSITSTTDPRVLFPVLAPIIINIACNTSASTREDQITFMIHSNMGSFPATLTKAEVMKWISRMLVFGVKTGTGSASYDHGIHYPATGLARQKNDTSSVLLPVVGVYPVSSVSTSLTIKLANGIGKTDGLIIGRTIALSEIDYIYVSNIGYITT